MLMKQDIGFVLEKYLAQPQGDNLEQESESGEVISKGWLGSRQGP